MECGCFWPIYTLFRMTKSFIIHSILIASSLAVTGCSEEFFKPHSNSTSTTIPTPPGQPSNPGSNPQNKPSFMTCMGFDELKGDVDTTLDEENCRAMESLMQENRELFGSIVPDSQVNDLFRTNPPMAISLSAGGIQKLFNASSIWAASPNAQIDITGCLQNDFPQNLFTEALTKDNCILIRFDMTVNGYQGKVKIGVPITATAQPKSGLISISADMSKSQFVKFETNKALDAYMGNVLENRVKSELQNYRINVPLFDISPWKLGSGNIRFYAATPKLQWNSAYQAIEIGLYTNMKMASNGVEFLRNAAHGPDAGFHIHPEILKAVTHRLMNDQNSGKPYITNKIAFSGKALSVEDQPDFEITQIDLSAYSDAKIQECSSQWKNEIPMAYRIWSAQKYCGYQDVIAGLNPVVQKNAFVVTASDINGADNKGAMSLMPAAFSQIESTDFMKSVAGYATQTINIGEIMTTQSKRKGTFSAVAASTGDHDKGFSFYSNLSGL